MCVCVYMCVHAWACACMRNLVNMCKRRYNNLTEQYVVGYGPCVLPSVCRHWTGAAVFTISVCVCGHVCVLVLEKRQL